MLYATQAKLKMIFFFFLETCCPELKLKLSLPNMHSLPDEDTSGSGNIISLDPPEQDYKKTNEVQAVGLGLCGPRMTNSVTQIIDLESEIQTGEEEGSADTSKISRKLSNPYVPKGKDKVLETQRQCGLKKIPTKILCTTLRKKFSDETKELSHLQHQIDIWYQSLYISLVTHIQQKSYCHTKGIQDLLKHGLIKAQQFFTPNIIGGVLHLDEKFKLGTDPEYLIGKALNFLELLTGAWKDITIPELIHIQKNKIHSCRCNHRNPIELLGYFTSLDPSSDISKRCLFVVMCMWMEWPDSPHIGFRNKIDIKALQTLFEEIE